MVVHLVLHLLLLLELLVDAMLVLPALRLMHLLVPALRRVLVSTLRRELASTLRRMLLRPVGLPRRDLVDAVGVRESLPTAHNPHQPPPDPEDLTNTHTRARPAGEAARPAMDPAALISTRVANPTP